MIDKLMKYTNLTSHEMTDLIRNSKNHYHSIIVKKRNGDNRTIYIPDESLKKVQTYILKHIIKPFPVSKYSKAYETGCSISKAVKTHVKSKHYLILDIQRFYENISLLHFEKLLNKKYCESDINTIWSLISYNNGLPIGTVTSPFVANRIMYHIDIEISKRLKKLKYTRYADDLTFSSHKKIDYDVIYQIRSLLREYNFNLNDAKTRFLGPNQSQRVLGLVLNNKKIQLGLKKRKEIKSRVYNFLVHNNCSKEEIRGHLSFAKQIEPDFVKELERKYKKFDYKKIWK